jgi:preprotein translocase subunit SecG
MEKFLDILLIITSLVLILLIILQQRGGSYGTFFGPLSNFSFSQRRGIEKYIYQITLFLVGLFLIISYFRVLILK